MQRTSPVTKACDTLKESASSFPPEFASFRILPSLVTALEYRGASAATIVPLVLQFGKNVSPDGPDRGTRMALLDNLSEYAERLDKKAVVDKIWPNLVRKLSFLCWQCCLDEMD